MWPDVPGKSGLVWWGWAWRCFSVARPTLRSPPHCPPSAPGACPKRSLTCHRALAGVSGGQGTDTVGRVRDLIPAVLDEDGVAAGHVRDVRDSVGAVLVVADGGLFRFAFGILNGERARESKY